VYLIPMTYDFEVDDLPKHPCLQINLVRTKCISVSS
jgi:hypothetical protein